MEIDGYSLLLCVEHAQGGCMKRTILYISPAAGSISGKYDV